MRVSVCPDYLVQTRIHNDKRKTNYDDFAIIQCIGQNCFSGSKQFCQWRYKNIAQYRQDPETGYVYLTPSGMDYLKCTEDDVVVCKENGEIVEGTRKPTIEKELHLMIYRTRPDVQAVVHTHPMYSTVFSCMGEVIPLILDEAAQTLGAPCKTCEYALPGTTKLAEVCAEALKDGSNSCLLQSHGAVCVGNSMESAFKVAKVLEVTAQIYYMIRATGGTPIALSQDDIKAMQEFVKYHYGQGK